MVKEIFAEAGIAGKKTNHSLRVAGATSLFSASVPERVIQGRTGHVSIEALRKYERVTENQELAVSKILTGEKDSFEQFPSSETHIASDNYSALIQNGDKTSSFNNLVF